MAGLLGEIFSAGNVAKRKLTDLLGNPLLSAQQFVGNVNDRARNLNEMTSAAAREGMDYGPATQRLAGLMADAYNPMGLTVFHGSPAKFNKFDRTKIGSGEGAQAYGYGHYSAENKDIAKGYQSTLTKDIVVPAQRALEKSGGDIDAAIKKATQEAQRLQSLDLTPQTGAAKRDQLLSSELSKIEELNRYKQGGEWSSGNFYEIDLPDEQIAKMVDFDKPLSSQSTEIKALAKQFGLLDADHMGGDLIAAMNAKLPAGAEAMRQAGVPGIRYLDQPSRDISQNYVVNIKDFGGYDFPTLSEANAFMKSNPQYEMELIEPQKITSNFVVFPGNEDLLTIRKRNGGLLD